jgi:hypothetical protein
VELEQRSGLEDHRYLLDPARAHEPGGQSKNKPIQCREIRCALASAVDNCQLVFECQRFGSHRAHATWSEQFNQGNNQMNRQNGKLAHERNSTTAVVVCKHGRVLRYLLN